jgi:hypothetical protein
VVLLDLENSRRHVRRQIRPLVRHAGDRLTRGGLTVTVHPQGLDLVGSAEDRAFLRDEVIKHHPDLLVAGPVYKMGAGDPTEEAQARAITAEIDQLRELIGFALILEAHSPYAASGKTQRPLRPYGASLWSRWPEFGIHLGEDGKLTHWRGARDEREWPARLQRGGSWPWTIDTASAYEPTDEIDRAILTLLADNPEQQRSQTEVIKHLRERGHQFRDTAVRDRLRVLAFSNTIISTRGPRKAQLYRHNPERHS